MERFAVGVAAMSFDATSRRDCNRCVVGLGPSSRPKPKTAHESETSIRYASALRREVIGARSVASISSFQVGMWEVTPVALAAATSSEDLEISASMNSA